MLKRALELSHELLAEVVRPGDTVLDGTMGNGHDTLFLRNLVESTGTVFSFDIQQEALEVTKRRFEEADISYENVHLILDNHANIANYVPRNIKGAIFNLGYLPTGNKEIITKKESTLAAINGTLPLLLPKGRIALVLYYGHPGGQEEKEAVLAFASALPQEEYTVATYSFLNQVHQPPILVVIEKKN